MHWYAVRIQPSWRLVNTSAPRSAPTHRQLDWRLYWCDGVISRVALFRRKVEESRTISSHIMAPGRLCGTTTPWMALTFTTRSHWPVRYGNSACLFKVAESQKLKIQNETQHEVFVALWPGQDFTEIIYVHVSSMIWSDARFLCNNRAYFLLYNCTAQPVHYLRSS